MYSYRAITVGQADLSKKKKCSSIFIGKKCAFSRPIEMTCLLGNSPTSPNTVSVVVVFLRKNVIVLMSSNRWLQKNPGNLQCFRRLVYNNNNNNKPWTSTRISSPWQKNVDIFEDFALTPSSGHSFFISLQVLLHFFILLTFFILFIFFRFSLVFFIFVLFLSFFRTLKPEKIVEKFLL